MTTPKSNLPMTKNEGDGNATKLYNCNTIKTLEIVMQQNFDNVEKTIMM
jgi:hypothetical protein